MTSQEAPSKTIGSTRFTVAGLLVRLHVLLLRRIQANCMYPNTLQVITYEKDDALALLPAWTDTNRAVVAETNMPALGSETIARGASARRLPISTVTSPDRTRLRHNHP